MKLSTSDLDAGEIRLQTTMAPGEVAALAALHEAGEVRFEAPLAVELRAFRSRDMIAVRGRLTTRVRMACARCLTRHLEDLDLAFELSYLQDKGPAVAEAGEDTQLDAVEAGLMRFEGDDIDLSEGLGEQIIMALPFKPLCDPDCKGLCSQCGANLNQTHCTCTPSASESPFAVLEQLRGAGPDE